MKKVFKIDVDCANCASKMETACSKLDGVRSVSINFMTQKIAIDFADGASVPDVLKSILKTCRKVERHCDIYVAGTCGTADQPSPWGEGGGEADG